MSRAVLTDCDFRNGVGYRAPSAVDATDIYELLRFLVFQGLGAWLLPVRWWPYVASSLGRLNVSLHPARTRESLQRLRAVLKGQEDMIAPIDIERGFYGGRYEERFQYLRSHRPGGWNPRIRIHGTEHVEAARTTAKGIVLWAGNFAFNDLISKIAWSRLGLEVSHYTRPVHGLSKTRFGLRILNPLRTNVEDRYLAERVSAEDNVVGAMRILCKRLEESRTISITVGNRGRQLTEAPFLGGRIRLATGAPALARVTGATILPTYTLRAPNGSYDVTIGKALTSDRDNREAYVQDIVTQYAAQLSPFVQRHPEQWRGWRYTIPSQC